MNIYVKYVCRNRVWSLEKALWVKSKRSWSFSLLWHESHSLACRVAFWIKPNTACFIAPHVWKRETKKHHGGADEGPHCSAASSPLLTATQYEAIFFFFFCILLRQSWVLPFFHSFYLISSQIFFTPPSISLSAPVPSHLSPVIFLHLSPSSSWSPPSAERGRMEGGEEGWWQGARESEDKGCTLSLFLFCISKACSPAWFPCEASREGARHRPAACQTLPPFSCHGHSWGEIFRRRGEAPVYLGTMFVFVQLCTLALRVAPHTCAEFLNISSLTLPLCDSLSLNAKFNIHCVSAFLSPTPLCPGLNALYGNDCCWDAFEFFLFLPLFKSFCLLEPLWGKKHAGTKKFMK